jgi:thiol-disulfide isomerase/thioredoxin/YHS domain-containing protein
MHRKRSLFWLLAFLLILPSVGMTEELVRWEPTLDNAQRLAAQSNRLVLIHFWAPWCVVCKRMEAEVVNQPSVAADVTANYVPVKINADSFPATAQRYGVTALPTTVITTPQGQLLDSMRGRVEATEYVARLRRVATEAKQRGGAVYAQVPAGAAPPAAPVSTPPQTPPPAGPPATGVQPPSNNGPSLAASPPVGQPVGGSPPVADNRSADFLRRSQGVPAIPIAQPSSATPGPAATQPLANYASPAPAAVASTNTPLPAPALAQAYPPSQPPARPPTGPPAANPSPAAPAKNLTPQLPTINPPLGLEGYCPVALWERQQWTLGDRRWGVIHRGRTYLFSGPEEQRRFFTDPDHYAPAISGNDVVLATEQGQPVPGMREHGVFFGNRMYLFSSEATLEKFARNANVYVNQALGPVRTGANGGQSLQ